MGNKSKCLVDDRMGINMLVNSKCRSLLAKENFYYHIDEGKRICTSKGKLNTTTIYTIHRGIQFSSKLLNLKRILLKMANDTIYLN